MGRNLAVLGEKKGVLDCGKNSFERLDLSW